jgi:hypothetical protein
MIQNRNRQDTGMLQGTSPIVEPSRPQNLFEYIISVFFLVPALLAVSACMIAIIILSPVIWLVEGRRSKVPSPVVAPPPAMQTLPTPASEADARSLEIQDQIEAESRQIAWEQIRAANAKRKASTCGRFLKAERERHLARVHGEPTNAQVEMARSMAVLEYGAFQAESENTLRSLREAREHRRLLLRVLADFEKSLVVKPPGTQHDFGICPSEIQSAPPARREREQAIMGVGDRR